MTEIDLFTYWRSSCAYRVRILLNLKGLDYKKHSVHLIEDGGQQNSSEFSTLNPLNQVPFYRDPQIGIGQSMAIAEYLEELHPSPALFPPTAEERAQAREFCEILNSGIQPLQNLRVNQYLSSELNADPDQVKRWNKHWIERGLLALEARAKSQAGDFYFGNEPGICEAFLVPQLFSSRRFGAEVEKFPSLLRLEKNCEATDAFAQAHPSKQPDAVS